MNHISRFVWVFGLLLVLMNCKQQDPWHDSDEWDPETTARHLNVLLKAQVDVLQQAVDLDGLPQNLRQELWAVLVDECDTGYEVFVRVNRNGRLKQQVCDALSSIVGDLQSRKVLLLEQLQAEGQSSILESTAPSHEAWEVLKPRINGYSVQALQIRCRHPEGYWDWSIPSD